MSANTISSVPSFKLSHGPSRMPAIGMGCWRGSFGKGQDDEMPKALRHAIEQVGYRHLDTASLYENEDVVADAIEHSGIPRKDFFITTKVWNTEHRNVPLAMENSLRRLRSDYVDLYLLHWPQGEDPDGSMYGEPTNARGPSFVEVWKQLEELHRSGKARAIGVSNFSIANLKVLLTEATVVPAVNQVETHPYHPDFALDSFCRSKGIHLSAYAPLGAGGSGLLQEEAVLNIARRLNVSAGQVTLAWNIAHGRSVLPKSANEQRMLDNFIPANLTDKDVASIDAIIQQDHSKQTRLSHSMCDLKKGTTFGWTLDQLGWDVGFNTVDAPLLTRRSES